MPAYFNNLLINKLYFPINFDYLKLIAAMVSKMSSSTFSAIDIKHFIKNWRKKNMDEIDEVYSATYAHYAPDNLFSKYIE